MRPTDDLALESNLPTRDLSTSARNRNRRPSNTGSGPIRIPRWRLVGESSDLQNKHGWLARYKRSDGWDEDSSARRGLTGADGDGVGFPHDGVESERAGVFEMRHEADTVGLAFGVDSGSGCRGGDSCD